MVNIVALFVSAWIEMILQYSGQLLKLGRTLCECVDWNLSLIYRLLVTQVALFVSAWIEISYIFNG